jgi:hypothetical protein
MFVPHRKHLRASTVYYGEHINTLCGHFSSYLTGDTLRLRYKAQPVNAVWGNSRCLLRNCTEHINTLLGTSVRTSQETHYVSATKPSRLMLCGETVAVYCENRTEHINTLLGTSVRTSQETHYVSATKPSRLMLCGETVAVYCENRTEHINTLSGHFSSYLTGDTLRLNYRAQPVNAIWGNSRNSFNR